MNKSDYFRLSYRKVFIFPTVLCEAICSELDTKPPEPLNRSVIDNVYPSSTYGEQPSS